MKDYLIEVTILYRVQAESEEDAKDEARDDIGIGQIVSMEIEEA